MRFQSVMALGLISSVFAAPVQNTKEAKFDLPAVQQTFNDIQAGIDKMVADVKAYTGKDEQMPAILEDSGGIQKILAEGAQKVAKSPAMGLMDAIGILGPVQTLSSKVDEIIISLAEKKELLMKNNVGGVVLGELQKQKSGAEALVKSITGNLPMPALIGPIAGPIAKQITDKLESGIKQWS